MKYSVAFVFFLASAALAGQPCAPAPTRLCLSGGRFEVKVTWKDFQNNTGAGQAVALTPDTGYFWFFSDSNVELIVKVLDARALNGKFWVFFGALSNVEYDLRVTDSVTGASKAYHNPSGQFASVGDTSAFDAAGGTTIAHERVTVAGTRTGPASIEAVQRFIQTAVPAARAFTPCKTVASTLVLSNCRFALNVAWDDSHGRTGRGTPVQLTNDTGYFWFFNDSNVELVVKVLDARPVNGQFWVFFGALSNVQYTLTVTDSLSGTVKTYRNSSGTFASVGDTEAFHVGRAVTVSKDSDRAVSATIGPTGGTLAADAADGTHFVLNLPPEALARPATIRMTPLSGVNGLPFSRGFVGGVQLEPEGLQLRMPATLTIRPSGPLRPGAVGFSYVAGGDELALDLTKQRAGEIEIQILHFSGYGSGNATSGNIANQSGFVPSSVIEAIRQQIAVIVERTRPHEDENGTEIPPEITPEEGLQQITDVVIDAFDRYLTPALASLAPECNLDNIKAVASLILSTLKGIQYLGIGEDLAIQALTTATLDKMVEILQTCEQKAHDDCVQFQDPLQAFTMVQIERELQLFGAPVAGITNPGGLIESCLRFELQFDSSITANIDLGGATVTVPVSATVPLRMDPELSTRDVNWKGSGTTQIGSWSVHVQDKYCTKLAVNTTTATFTVGNQVPANLIPLATSYSEEDAPAFFTQYDIDFGYQPGDPLLSYSVRCVDKDGKNPVNFDSPLESWWLGGYLVNHIFDFKADGFEAEGWDVYALPGIYARKEYQDHGGFTKEATTLLLKHTPDK